VVKSEGGLYYKTFFHAEVDMASNFITIRYFNPSLIFVLDSVANLC